MTATMQEREIAIDAVLRLRLYVAGDAPNSILAIRTLNAAVKRCSGPIEVEIIDVLRDPERGFTDGVLVTPMLVRVAPLPERRLLGNLSDSRTLLGVLAIADPCP